MTRIVLDKELPTEILFNLNDIQREIFEMLLKGYNKSDIEKLLSITYSTLNKQLKDLQIVVKQCLAM